jgi:shikimate dehydrogenase
MSARDPGNRWERKSADMLFEQIPAYLEFFDFPTTTADDLRKIARLI